MRVNRLFALAAFGAFLVGCYTLQPTGGTAPEPGSQVAFDVTDVGRVALGGSMGPGIEQIEGRLVEAQNGDYVVAVSAVKLLRGGQQIWAGERVRIDKEHVGRVYERRFSKGRTIALGVVAVGGAAVLLANQGFDVFSGRRGPDTPPDSFPELIWRRPMTVRP